LNIFREYCHRGYEIVLQISSLNEVAEIVYSHREKFNGTGFPRRLKGEAIPLGARVVNASDTVLNILSYQPHRRRHTVCVAQMEIQRWSGIDFDGMSEYECQMLLASS